MPVYPYTLMDVIYTKTVKLTIDQKIRVFYQVTTAITFLHSQKVLHLDIKPHNIFLTADLMAKLGDFGLVLPQDNLTVPRYVGGAGVNLWDRGAEILLQDARAITHYVSAETDIWQLAYTMVSLFTESLGRFPLDSRYEDVGMWLDAKGQPRQDAPPEIASLTKDQLDALLIAYRLSMDTRFTPENIRTTLTTRLGESVPSIVVDLLSRMMVLSGPTKYTNMMQVVADPLFASFATVTGTVSPITQSSTIMTTLSRGVQLIMGWAKAFSTDPCATLFDAIDLLYCSAAILKGDGIELHAFTCLFMAHKLNTLETSRYDESLLPTLPTYKHNVSFRVLEVNIVAYLKGQLRRPYLYATCRTRMHVTQALREVVVVPELYLKLDITTWRTYYATEPTINKDQLLMSNL